MSEEKIYNCVGAANRVGCSTKTICKAISNNRLIAERRKNSERYSLYRITESDLLDWDRRRKVVRNNIITIRLTDEEISKLYCLMEDNRFTQSEVIGSLLIHS